MVMGGLAEEMLVDFSSKVQAFLARVREEATTIDLDAMRQEAARLIMEAQR